jgi:hypothetical protein
MLVNARTISGLSIAHSKATPVVRAFNAADWTLGATTLCDPTQVQAARIWNVSMTYVQWALKRYDKRFLIESGAIPLVPQHVKAPPAPPPDDLEALTALATKAGPNKWLEAAIAAGF